MGTTPDPTLDHREVPRELPSPTRNRSFRIVLGLNLENRCSNKCTHPYRLEGNLEWTQDSVSLGLNDLKK